MPPMQRMRSRRWACSGEAWGITAPRISCTWIAAIFGAGAVEHEVSKIAAWCPCFCLGLLPAIERCPRRAWRTDLHAELFALSQGKWRGRAQRLSKLGRVAGRAGRSYRSGTLDLESKAAGLDPGGAISDPDVALRLAQGCGCRSSTDLYTFQFRQCRAARRHRNDRTGPVGCPTQPYTCWSNAAERVTATLPSAGCPRVGC